MAKKKATKKRPAKARPSKKTATKKSVNKAQAIRDYSKSNPGAGPTAISKALASKGVKVTAGQVSTTLSNAKKNGKKKSPAAKAKMKSREKATNDSVSIAMLLATQKFVKEVGDISTARHLIDVVGKIQG